MPYATPNLKYIFHHSIQIFITTSNFFLEAIDHPIPEIKIVMIVIWRFRINTPKGYGKITRCDTRKYGYLQLS